MYSSALNTVVWGLISWQHSTGYLLQIPSSKGLLYTCHIAPKEKHITHTHTHTHTHMHTHTYTHTHTHTHMHTHTYTHTHTHHIHIARGEMHITHTQSTHKHVDSKQGLMAGQLWCLCGCTPEAHECVHSNMNCPIGNIHHCPLWFHPSLKIMIT